MSQDRLHDLALNDNGFVFDPYSGATFTTNRVGLFIIRALQGGKKVREIVADIHEAFEVERADVERDLSEFVLVLRQQGLISGRG